MTPDERRGPFSREKNQPFKVVFDSKSNVITQAINI